MASGHILYASGAKTSAADALTKPKPYCPSFGAVGGFIAAVATAAPPRGSVCAWRHTVPLRCLMHRRRDVHIKNATRVHLHVWHGCHLQRFALSAAKDRAGLRRVLHVIASARMSVCVWACPGPCWLRVQHCFEISPWPTSCAHVVAFARNSFPNQRSTSVGSVDEFIASRLLRIAPLAHVWTFGQLSLREQATDIGTCLIGSQLDMVGWAPPLLQEIRHVSTRSCQTSPNCANCSCSYCLHWVSDPAMFVCPFGDSCAAHRVLEISAVCSDLALHCLSPVPLSVRVLLGTAQSPPPSSCKPVARRSLLGLSALPALCRPQRCHGPHPHEDCKEGRTGHRREVLREADARFPDQQEDR